MASASSNTLPTKLLHEGKEQTRKPWRRWASGDRTSLARSWPDPRAVVDGAGGVRGDGRGEGGRVLAAPGQAHEPQPGQGDHLGDQVLFPGRATDAAEVDPAVQLEPRQQRQERLVQGRGRG